MFNEGDGYYAQGDGEDGSDSFVQGEDSSAGSYVQRDSKSRLEENYDVGIDPASWFYVIVTVCTVRSRRGVGVGHEVVPYLKALVDVGALPDLASPHLTVVVDTSTCRSLCEEGVTIEIYEVPSGVS